MSMHTTSDTTFNPPPRRDPTPEDPTPNWRFYRELPDDRRYPALCPSTMRYTEAKVTDLRHACCCGSTQAHDSVVHADGTMYCEQTDSFFTAQADSPELKKMRRDYEDYIIMLARACELS